MDDQHWFIAGLHAFVGVDGLHSLKEADKRDGLPSKTSVDTRLKEFNKVLKCKVTGPGVKRTEAGKRIGDDAKEILKDLDQSIRRAHEHLKRLAQADRPVTIAMSPTIWMWGATPGKLPLTNSIPGHPSAEFLVANSARVEKVVRDGLFEIGITARSTIMDDAYEVDDFGKDEIVVLVPPGHEWETRGSLKSADLSSTPVITLDITAHARQVVDAAMEEAGCKLAEPEEEAATAGLVLDVALRAKKPALVPELALLTPQGQEADDAGFRKKRVKDLELGRDFVLIYQNSKMLRKEARETLAELRGLQFPQ
jgi:DNA-binding transcriptional LysR family regulator